jgi:hypothetical protein
MRKPSAAMMLSVLLALSWIGFFASQPRAAQNPTGEVWSYVRVDGEAELAKKGRDGWEAYAVRVPQGGSATTYFLKRNRIEQ